MLEQGEKSCAHINASYLVFWVPPKEDFTKYDTDKDGYISIQEFKAQKKNEKAFVASKVAGVKRVQNDLTLKK